MAHAMPGESGMGLSSRLAALVGLLILGCAPSNSGCMARARKLDVLPYLTRPRSFVWYSLRRNHFVAWAVYDIPDMHSRIAEPSGLVVSSHHCRSRLQLSCASVVRTQPILTRFESYRVIEGSLALRSSWQPIPIRVRPDKSCKKRKAPPPLADGLRLTVGYFDDLLRNGM